MAGVGGVLQGAAAIGSLIFSDRDAKENIATVNADSVAASLSSLPVSRWNYKGDDTPHIGPMAQDFKASFDLGGDGKTISIIDALGVLMASMQSVMERLDRIEKAA